MPGDRFPGEDKAAQGRVESRSFLHAFARRCLEEKVVEMEVTDLEDGSVLLGPLRIKRPARFLELLLR